MHHRYIQKLFLVCFVVVSLQADPLDPVVVKSGSEGYLSNDGSAVLEYRKRRCVNPSDIFIIGLIQSRFELYEELFEWVGELCCDSCDYEIDAFFNFVCENRLNINVRRIDGHTPLTLLVVMNFVPGVIKYFDDRENKLLSGNRMNKSLITGNFQFYWQMAIRDVLSANANYGWVVGRNLLCSPNENLYEVVFDKNQEARIRAVV